MVPNQVTKPYLAAGMGPFAYDEWRNLVFDGIFVEVDNIAKWRIQHTPYVVTTNGMSCEAYSTEVWHDDPRQQRFISLRARLYVHEGSIHIYYNSSTSHKQFFISGPNCFRQVAEFLHQLVTPSAS